jgi:ATP-dependent Clp protease ATP-binding subunit ClpC
MERFPLTEKLTIHAKRVLKEARDIAFYSHCAHIEPKHIFLALFLEQGSLGKVLLENIGFKQEPLAKITLAAKSIKGMKKSKSKAPEKTNLGFSPSLKKIFTRAFAIAKEFRSPYVGTEHLVAALTESDNTDIRSLFNDFALKQEKSLETIHAHLNYDHLPPLSKMFNLPEISLTRKKSSSDTHTPFLDQYAIDLGKEAPDEPFIGRTHELERLIHILGRKQKNNPLLLGDPGVGKTALVTALAKKIIEGTAGNFLAEKRILALDLALVVAGTSFRGEFEARLKEIVREVKNNPNIILFIDEIHTLVGAGNTSGGLDAANILKPALARGDIRLIGATTFAEYKRHIEKDPALERRFQSILVREPSREEALAILLQSKHSFENFHEVALPDEIVTLALDLALRHIHDRFLPDKVFDLIDEAASAVRHKTEETPVQNRHLSVLRERLAGLIREKNIALEEENYDEASRLYHEEKQTASALGILEKKDVSPKKKTRVTVTHEDLFRALSHSTGIPFEKLSIDHDTASLRNITSILEQSVIGQKEATDTIARILIRSAAGIRDTDRPIGSFLFLGPSGVGKTLLAKTIATHFFGNDRAFIRLDMSEFGERHNVAQMIGSPAGYVGYGEGGKLTEKIRREPHSVVLFDEIEKAHPDTANILLQILEDGFLTDAEGRKADFRHALIILTSNIGTLAFTESAKIGFDQHASSGDFEHRFQSIKQGVLEELKRTLRPELLSRLGDTLVFQPLTKSAIELIVKQELEKLKARLKKKGVILTYPTSILSLISEKGFLPSEGARPIRKKIEQDIEQPVAEFLLTHPKKKKLSLAIKNKKIIVK